MSQNATAMHYPPLPTLTLKREPSSPIQHSNKQIIV